VAAHGSSTRKPPKKWSDVKPGMTLSASAFREKSQEFKFNIENLLNGDLREYKDELFIRVLPRTL